MPIIVVANPKGGVGKSTLATNIAGYYARRGRSVMLGDCDRQQSSRLWLGLRPDGVPPITNWVTSENNVSKPPKGTTHAVLDTPAGLHGWRYRDVIRVAHKIVVPLQPSIFDMYPTQAFIEELQREQASRRFELAIVGMRIDARTRAAENLQRFCEEQKLPVLTCLRDTQNYIQLAARGLSLWDAAPSRIEKDIEQWMPLVEWLDA